MVNGAFGSPSMGEPPRISLEASLMGVILEFEEKAASATPIATTAGMAIIRYFLEVFFVFLPFFN
jgi:hypothetical protein